jgi:hypothetical protein
MSDWLPVPALVAVEIVHGGGGPDSCIAAAAQQALQSLIVNIN